MEIKNETVNCIRKFNRFYTVLLGFLNQNYLGTGYSVTETRILFEIYQCEGISAKEICDLLKLDKSYMSRLIRGFEKDGIISRKVSEKDKRANSISLTEKGKTEVQGLIELTNSDISQLVDSLDDDTCEQVCFAIEFLMDKLDQGRD